MELELFKRILALILAATTETKKAYAASGTTAIVSVLTFNQVVGAIGVILSVAIAAFTAWSNHKKNQKQMTLIDLQTEEIQRNRQVDEAQG